LRNIINSARPRQWVKNLTIFLPLLFTGNLFINPILIQGGITFLSFSLVASGIYFFNDIIDFDQDQQHPRKKFRPIASGKISKSFALSCSFILVFLGVLTGGSVKASVGIILLIYVFVNIAYSTVIKKILFLDVMAIALGFILRVYAGSELTGFQASPWILSTTYLLSLMLGFGKRRGELASLGENSNNHRKVLEHYTLELLDQILTFLAGCVIMSYILYTFSDYTVQRFGSNLFWTIPFVMYGVFRFFYLTHTKKFYGDPTEIFLKDYPLLGCVILWGILCVILIYS